MNQEAADLFNSQENAQYALFFSLLDIKAPLGWIHYAISSSQLDLPHPSQGERAGFVSL